MNIERTIGVMLGLCAIMFLFIFAISTVWMIYSLAVPGIAMSFLPMIISGAGFVVFSTLYSLWGNQ